MPIEERKSEELSQKLAGFSRGVEEWLKQRRKETQYRVHTSQLAAVEALLSGVSAGIAREIKSASGNGSLLARSMGIEEMILTAYQVWDFYRPKMGQRLETQFQTYLRIADELAWLCYRPVRDRVYGSGPEAKEPPLVYLNAEWSPFVKERRRRYQLEGVPDALLSRQPDFDKAVAQLPFAVIGIPWYQAGFLPGGLTIAHEVGHVVIAECGLQDRLIAAMDGVRDASRRPRWAAWAEEMFADAFGCLAVGPAFAFSLADALAADRATVNANSETCYPSHSLRIRLNHALLVGTGHHTRAAELWGQWSQQYPQPYPWSDFEKDVDIVAESLLNVPIDLADGSAAAVRSLLSFPPASDQAAQTYVQETQKGIVKSVPDLRVRWAAALFSYRSDPAGFVRTVAPKSEVTMASRFQERLKDVCRDDLRAGERPAAKDRLRHLTALGETLSQGPQSSPDSSLASAYTLR